MMESAIFNRVSLGRHLDLKDQWEERFWSYVDKSAGPDGCWIWNGFKKGQMNYGCFKISSYTNAMSHRISWALANNKDPGQMVVCHACDNPPCCNPKHLWLGTMADNNRDCNEKGRRPKTCQTGEKNNAAKLTADQVAVIKGLIGMGYANTRIAEQYGVTHHMISKIKLGVFLERHCAC